MTNLYTVIQGLEVTSDEILQAELLAEKILEARYPDIDLRQGTGLRDLVIRPSATLLALINRALAYYFAQNTLSGVTDNSPTEIVDKILSNWFLERKAGKKSVISARLYFATQKSVTIGTQVFFSPDNTKRFYPLITYSFSASQLTYEPFSGEYYVDIDLVADKEGPEYDLTSGSLLYFANFDAYFLRGEINYLRELATVTETNSQFIKRAETAISTRNLINRPSIEAKLREDFDYIKAITSIGHGDPEMYRDQVKVTTPQTEDPVLIHIGGKTDTYVRVPLETKVSQFSTDGSGLCEIEGPFLEVSRSSFSGSTEEDTLPMTRDRVLTSLTNSGTTATGTYVNHGFLNGETVTISGAIQAAYNGTFVIQSVPTADTFTYTMLADPGAPATGTVTAKVPVSFTVSYPDRITQNVTIAKAGNVVTITAPSHGANPERYVEIRDAEEEGFNGYFKIQSVTANTITVINTDGSLPSAATGFPTITLTNYMADHGHSSRQRIHVNFGAGYANKTVSFSTYGFQGVEGIQTYIEGEDRKVLAGDPLIRGYNVYLLDLSIVGYNSTPPSAALCAEVTTAYLESLEPGAPFIMADLIAKLNASGIGTIRTPIDVSYRYFHRDNIPFKTGTITDFLDPKDRTAIFMLEDLATTNEYL